MPPHSIAKHCRSLGSSLPFGRQTPPLLVALLALVCILLGLLQLFGSDLGFDPAAVEEHDSRERASFGASVVVVDPPQRRRHPSRGMVLEVLLAEKLHRGRKAFEAKMGAFRRGKERNGAQESGHSHNAGSSTSIDDGVGRDRRKSRDGISGITDGDGEDADRIEMATEGMLKLISSSSPPPPSSSSSSSSSSPPHPDEAMNTEQSRHLHSPTDEGIPKPYIGTKNDHGHGHNVHGPRPYINNKSGHGHSSKEGGARPHDHKRGRGDADRLRHGANRPRAREIPKAVSLREAIAVAQKRGAKAWKEIEALPVDISSAPPPAHKKSGSEIIRCPKSIFMGEQEMKESRNFLKLPCGLTHGSSITMIGVPLPPHYEEKPQIGHVDGGSPISTLVSQFVFELHAPKDGDEQKEVPKILHINPRLTGDWSDKPVIELNTFLKGRWGRSQRCDGTSSLYYETVERLPKCEKWLPKGEPDVKESSWWLSKLIEKIEMPETISRFPFYHNHSFIMTLRAGLEGYHMNVDGKHIASFPYTTGLLEELTLGLYVGGDVNVRAMIATSLPSLPSKSLQERFFEKWQLWRAPSLPKNPINLFIGVLSAPDHFAQRLAIRSAWFQSEPIKSSRVVTRFFVAMHQDKEVNLQMKKEAAHYGDMVILPFMDEYNLVVLKTLAICEYGVYNVSTKYIMKCDDDTFVRVDAVLDELKAVSRGKDLYMGNMNMFHRPLRTGKWAVTVEEWPDEAYPTYANGAGYIISTSIAKYVVSERRQKTLELFKMEDVSMGLWVHQFRLSGRSIEYVNVWRFCQLGCADGYVSAHYQSPRQMVCLHQKLSRGDIHCCN